LTAVDSIGVTARLLARLPEGLHPGSVQSYINPHMRRECSEFAELTGKAGDMALIHPYMVHRVAANPSGIARFAQFPSITLTEPMKLARDDHEYSLVELVVLKELGKLERFDFATEQDYVRCVRSHLRVRVETMGSQKCGVVGISQTVLIMINPIIFTRTCRIIQSYLR
jgi:hypothetical protein